MVRNYAAVGVDIDHAGSFAASMQQNGFRSAQTGSGDSIDLLIMGASQFETALRSVPPCWPTESKLLAEGSLILGLVVASTAPRWHEITTELVRAAAIGSAPMIRVNAICAPGESERQANVAQLTEIIAFLAASHALTGQCIRLDSTLSDGTFSVQG